MVKTLLVLALISGIVSSEASKLRIPKDRVSIVSLLAHKRIGIPHGQLHDQCLKQGSFKIDDGDVIGGGIYEIKDNGVDINMKIKITSSEKAPCVPKPVEAPGGATTPAPGGTTTPVPGGATTPAPGGATTPAPGGATTPVPGGATTPAPGGATTPAPGGATTPAPGGATTPAPGGATTPAPGGATTPAPGGATTPAPGGATTSAPGGATTPAPGGATTSAPGGSGDEQEALTLHNKFRKIHDAPEMKLNAEMSQSAESYAAKLANQGSMQHSTKKERDNAGENLSYGCSSSKGQTAEEAITNWYNEVCKPGYTFGSERMGGAGHFTQVVWKESVELGFGKAESSKGSMKCTYYVGRYKIAGNMNGEVAKNVVKGSFDPSYCDTISKQ